MRRFDKRTRRIGCRTHAIAIVGAFTVAGGSYTAAFAIQWAIFVFALLHGSRNLWVESEQQIHTRIIWNIKLIFFLHFLSFPSFTGSILSKESLMQLFELLIIKSRNILQKAFLLLPLPAFEMCCAVVLYWLDAITKFTGIDVMFEVCSIKRKTANVIVSCVAQILIYFSVRLHFSCWLEKTHQRIKHWTRDYRYTESTKSQNNPNTSSFWWNDPVIITGGYRQSNRIDDHRWCD